MQTPNTTILPTDSSGQPPMVFPITGAVLSVAGGMGLGVVFAWGIVASMGWLTDGSAIMPAAGVWAIAAAMGLGLLILATQRRLDRLATAVLASSVVRMLVAMGLGVALFLAIKPEGKPFWTTFLCVGVSCLIAESAWALRQMNRLTSATSPPSPTPGRVQGSL